MSAPSEPRLSRALIHLLSGEDAEFVLGDLSEDFRALARTSGEVTARRWYRRQAWSTIGTRLFSRPASIEAWGREVRLAGRRLRRDPGYAMTAVVTLALGVGGVVGVLALAVSVLRPLPFPDADDLVAVWETHQGEQRWVAPANYLDWRRESDAFSLAAHDTRNVSVDIGGTATHERIAMVSGNFFEVLGVVPATGRGFDPALDVAFPDRLVVLSAGARNRSFEPGSEPLGRTVLIDDVPHVVVGVAPNGLSFPESDLFGWIRSPTEAPDIRDFDGDLTGMRDAWYFQVVGRIGSGWTPERAAAELADVAAALERRHPDTNRDAGVRVVSLLEQTVADFRATLIALALAVVLILVGSIFNLVHLTMARTIARRRDFSVRAALGASRRELRRGILVEGGVIGTLGAVLGLGLARIGLDVGVRHLGGAIPRAAEIGLPAGRMAPGLLLGMLAGVLVAWVAWARLRRVEAGPRAASVREGREGPALVAVQVAVSIAILSGTVLLAGSLSMLGRVDVGFDTDGLGTMRVALPDAGSRGYAERVTRFREIADMARSVPGVRSAAVGANAPVEMGPRAGVVVVGDPPTDDPPNAGWQPVDADYFDVLGIEVARGRSFSSADGADADDVAVVNEAFVGTVLGGRPALGERVTMGLDGHDRPLTIVGVVDDTRTQGPAAPAGPVLYRPIDQTGRFGARSVFLAVRAEPGVTGVIAAVTTAIRAGAPGLPLYAEASGSELVRGFHRAQSVLLAVMLAFAATAAAIGLVGVYGVGIHAVRRQRRAIGVRMALGATSWRITGETVRRGMRAAALGIVPGIVLALAVGRALRGMLFEVAPTDPALLAGVCLGVLAMTASALLLPARSAARTDPAQATRDG